MREGFAAALAAELVVVIAIAVCAAVIINMGTIGMEIMEWMSP